MSLGDTDTMVDTRQHLGNPGGAKYKGLVCRLAAHAIIFPFLSTYLPHSRHILRFFRRFQPPVVRRLAVLPLLEMIREEVGPE